MRQESSQRQSRSCFSSQRGWGREGKRTFQLVQQDTSLGGGGPEGTGREARQSGIKCWPNHRRKCVLSPGFHPISYPMGISKVL